MNKYLVSRHLSTTKRLLKAGIVGKSATHIDKNFLNKLKYGDEVYGNLPLHLIYEILIRGAYFYSTIVKFTKNERLFMKPLDKNSPVFIYKVLSLLIINVGTV